MRDFMGAHVSRIDDFNTQVDVDKVYINSSVRGSFRVKYSAQIDKICVGVESRPGIGDTTMQLTLTQAKLLRDLLDDGIADAIAALPAPVLELPSGGAA
ncbi:hypothetical protein ACFVMC_26605 [Nocardia sp. NPDC127579]|uniref:hypothetical protein n=1 Tax=Nocardia sp. NPDC127579 TaxID=3345402 RepID=UPI0036355B80